MQMLGDFDIVVVGGGPAGLLLASKLSKEARVAVLEKRKFGVTAKFWLTNPRRLSLHDLSESEIYSTNQGTVGSFLGKIAVAKGAYSVVDENKLLSILIARCRQHGVELRDREELTALKWNRDKLNIATRKGVISSRLLIDATGGSSSIAATFRMHRLLGFYSIYGAHLDNLVLHTTDIVGAHVLNLGFPAPMFEVIPTGEKSAFCVIFVATKRLVAPRTLQAIFEEHCANNPFFSISRSAKNIEGKMGAIPIGRCIRRRLPGVAAFGEAALLQSPLLGTAFNETLEYCDSASDQIIQSLRARSSGIPNIYLRYPVIKRVNDLLQLHLVRNLIDGTTEDFERISRILYSIGPERSYKLFCTQLNWLDLSLTFLASIRLRGRLRVRGDSS